ncbi:MAG: CapA family protein, partial [Chloroflexi bacterium]|nr:CapA family protein [Chloroflexota bacterium]
MTSGPARRVSRSLAVFVALLPALLVACDRDGTASPVTAPDVAVSPAAATATSTAVAPEPRPAVVIDVADPDEAADLDRQLVAAGFDVASEAPTRISDAPGDSSALEHARQPFALVVHPRLPLHDVTLEEAVAILDGTGNLGRNLVVSDTAAAWLARTHLAAATAARGGEPAAVIAEVAATPGLAGLVSMEELDPRVRALTIGGHDPYRDPWSDSPLLDRRTVAGPHAEAVAVALGWTAAMLPDPVGFLATGELIAARCVTDRVARLEARYDAIFDGTRHLLGAADLAMAHWEPAIVDDTPTPCTRTFNMSTRPEAAAAAARAGIDVALAVGNH